MNQTEKDILYKLFRNHEDVIGSLSTTMLALDSLVASIHKLKCSREGFKGQLMEITDVVKNTEPKNIPLVHLLEEFEKEMPEVYEKSLQEQKDRAVNIIEQKKQRLGKDMQGVTEKGMNLVENGDVIIVHSTSSVVRDSLIRAHRDMKKKFKVLILKQDFVKTRQVINAFSQAGMEFVVVPEYNLSHSVKTADKLFIGAVSITPDRQVVASAGTANVVSLCHLNKVPVYLLVASLKFAHKSLESQQIHQKEEDMNYGDLHFSLSTFSHDRVDLELIDHLITEEGEVEIPVSAG